MCATSWATSMRPLLDVGSKRPDPKYTACPTVKARACTRAAMLAALASVCTRTSPRS
ncbi:MAG: hypothetical protein NT062_12525 [Proteobacteria bacterium]|nr:hypothetical protein [Pseudomonadota bacterium]